VRWTAALLTLLSLAGCTQVVPGSVGYAPSGSGGLRQSAAGMADGHLGTALVEQLTDRALESAIRVVHPTRVGAHRGPRQQAALSWSVGVEEAAGVRRIGIVLLSGLMLSAAGLVVAAPAAACSCAGIPTTAGAFASADAVFTGRLVSREVQHPNAPMRSSEDPALHVFAVDEVFKGVVHEQQGVVSADSGASCGLELSGAGPFVVFAAGSADRYTAALCDGSGALTPEVTEELRALADTASDGPAPPRPGAAGTDVPGLPTAVFATGGAAVLGLALVGWLLVHRRRRTASSSRSSGASQRQPRSSTPPGTGASGS
jgi:hypothetical protein